MGGTEESTRHKGAIQASQPREDGVPKLSIRLKRAHRDWQKGADVSRKMEQDSSIRFNKDLSRLADNYLSGELYDVFKSTLDEHIAAQRR